MFVKLLLSSSFMEFQLLVGIFLCFSYLFCCVYACFSGIFLFLVNFVINANVGSYLAPMTQKTVKYILLCVGTCMNILLP